MATSMRKESILDLDDILTELGHCGKFHIKNYILLSITIFASALYTLSYVFTTINPSYRCLIPECENFTTTEYKPDWLMNAVPFVGTEPERCKRYQFMYENTTSNFNESEKCPADIFNHQSEIGCNDLYYVNWEHTSIAHDFNIFCGEHWKLTLPGTIHNIGQFFSYPLTGIISDRFGRKFALVAGLVSSAVFGLCRSFSTTYIWFVFFEFLDAAIGSAAYASAFVLGTEIVSPKKRVVVSTMICCFYSIGEAFIGVVAWMVPDWRDVLRIIYGPGLLMVFYFWIAPESLRWLIAKGRHKEVEDIIKNVAKQNGVTLSQKALGSIDSNFAEVTLRRKQGNTYPIRDILKSLPMLIRLIICAFCWITCSFVFYGLSINSVEIAGNIYMNFIAISLIEIPGLIICYLCLDRFGRRKSLSGSFLVSGIACVIFIFVSENIFLLKLFLYLIGKCLIAMAFLIVYVYTAELFPTPLRQTMLGLCSMFGRIGSIIAPQMPLLAEHVWAPLPVLLFGSISIIAGLLVLPLPETLNIKLPDTIEEAINIGKKNVVDIAQKTTLLQPLQQTETSVES